MSKGKHTPGPWIYQPADDHCGPYVTDETNCPSGTVCDLYHFPPVVVHKPEEAEANARLIAAAPETKDAAKAIDAYWTAQFPEGPIERQFPLIGEPPLALWLQVRAAVAKAEGTS